MKIVFWGTPQYAALNLKSIINEGYNVIAVVTQPDRKRGRGKQLTPSEVRKVAIDNDIPVFITHSISNDQHTKKSILSLNADIFIVVAFGQILPLEIIRQPKLGSWNSHASLLPKWRGAAPIQWSLINNDYKTGVCIMAMDDGLDTGPVIKQESIKIDKVDNYETLTNKLCKISSTLLIKSLKDIEKTIGFSVKERLNKLQAIDQKLLAGYPCYARQIKKEDYLIDWNTNAIKVLKKINGLYPNAYTFFQARRLKILEVVILDKSITINDNKIDYIIINKKLKGRLAGEVISIIKNVGFIVATNDFPILIISGKLQGKNQVDGYTLSIQSNIEISSKIGI